MTQDRPAALDPSAPPGKAAPPVPSSPRTGRLEEPRRPRRRWLWVVILLLLAAGGYYYWSKKNPAPTGGQGPGAAGANARKGGGAIPVVAAQAHRGNIPVYYTGLGQVTPIYTVQVQSRVSGELLNVYFKEGDIVHKGDPLVEIDPRPFQATLTQAEG